jgi:hypothetical protein
MENQPQNIIAIGRKRFPIEEIALVEPFEPPAEQPPPRLRNRQYARRQVLARAGKPSWPPAGSAGWGRPAAGTGPFTARRSLARARPAADVSVFSQQF